MDAPDTVVMRRGSVSAASRVRAGAALLLGGWPEPGRGTAVGRFMAGGLGSAGSGGCARPPQQCGHTMRAERRRRDRCAIGPLGMTGTDLARSDRVRARLATRVRLASRRSAPGARPRSDNTRRRSHPLDHGRRGPLRGGTAGLLPGSWPANSASRPVPEQGRTSCIPGSNFPPGVPYSPVAHESAR